MQDTEGERRSYGVNSDAPTAAAATTDAENSQVRPHHGTTETFSGEKEERSNAADRYFPRAGEAIRL